MGLLDRVKAAGEQAVSTGQRQAQNLQAKRELSQAYHDLGETVVGLVERGEISHGDLAAGVDRVKELQTRLSGEDADGDAGAAGGSGDADIVE